MSDATAPPALASRVRLLGLIAAVVLAADVVSRLLVRPYEMPLGVITALIGAPVLVAVVRSTRLPAL